MPDIYLHVPFVTQLGFGDPNNPQNDRTGCWYASACMVAYFFEAGPRLGMPEKYSAKSGGHAPMMSEEYPTLMKNENLALIPLPESKRWRSHRLADLLRRNGPLSFGWNKKSPISGKFYGHRSVLIGYMKRERKAVFHDPENGPNTRISIDTLNERFRWNNPYAMLRRAGPDLVRAR